MSHINFYILLSDRMKSYVQLDFGIQNLILSIFLLNAILLNQVSVFAPLSAAILNLHLLSFPYFQASSVQSLSCPLKPFVIFCRSEVILGRLVLLYFLQSLKISLFELLYDFKHQEVQFYDLLSLTQVAIRNLPLKQSGGQFHQPSFFQRP